MKKIKSNDQSDPVVLTAKKQRAMARESFSKAKLLLGEAEFILKTGKAQGSCVSAAYYAMEHAASAAILLFGGVGKHKGYPKSHRDIMLLLANSLLLMKCLRLSVMRCQKFTVCAKSLITTQVGIRIRLTQNLPSRKLGSLSALAEIDGNLK